MRQQRSPGASLGATLSRPRQGRAVARVGGTKPCVREDGTPQGRPLRWRGVSGHCRTPAI